MARWYSTFDNSTIAALEASGKRYKRVNMTGGSGLRSTLVAARAALSAAAYAQMNTANINGASGVVVPADVVTRVPGTSFAWSNLYTNAGAIWPSDPSVRPTAQILAAGSTAVSPTDAGSINDVLYTDAVTALENTLLAMSGGGPRARYGPTPYRTLASLHHDHPLTYFAWDDFYPGIAQNFTAVVPGGGFAGNPVNVTLSWSFPFQYPWDEQGKIRLSAQVDRSLGGGGGPYTLNVAPNAIDGAYIWTIPGTLLTAGAYQIIATAVIEDATITSNTGPVASLSINPLFTLV